MRGFAVSRAAEIDLRTVSPTERAAKVNGFCVLFNVMPGAGWSDDQIAFTWAEFVSRHPDVRIVAVEVTAIHEDPQP